MFAVVDIRGFQEKVQKGDRLQVPLLDSEKGKKVVFDQVFLIVDGENVKIGTPKLAGVSVEATVLEHGKGDKIRVVKAHKRKRYRRVHGHRQDYSEIEITGIQGA